MIKLEAIMDFTLKEFDKIKDIVRNQKEETGKIFAKDIFCCDEEMAKYLTGENPINTKVANVIEIIPEKKKIRKANKKV